MMLARVREDGWDGLERWIRKGRREEVGREARAE
jgi:hypothetical protein